MNKIIFSMVLAGLFLLGVPTYASSYQYVNTSGDLSVVTADSSTEAIRTAPNIHPNSGVMLLSGVGGDDANVSGQNSYLYMDANGELRTVSASSSEDALSSSVNRHPNSGVMLVS